MLVSWILSLSLLTTTLVTDAQDGSSCRRDILPDELVREVIQTLPLSAEVAMTMLRDTLEQESRMGREMRFGRTERPHKAFRFVQQFLGSTTHGKQMSYAAFLQEKTLKLLKHRLQLTNPQIQEVMDCMPSPLRPNMKVMTADAREFPQPTATFCPYPSDVRCDPNAIYRTYDGRCNNLDNPLWGATHTPLARYLPPDYADAIEAPRVSRHGQMPSARLVSSTIHWDIDIPHHVHTSMLMQWGQFLDHDMSRTAISKLSMQPLGDLRNLKDLQDVECGVDGCQTSGLENQACFPIYHPNNDTDFGRAPCLMFVRSQEVPNPSCSLGPREQLNQITSYLDASLIYGSTQAESEAIRDNREPRRGKLRMTVHPEGFRYKPLLPKDPAFEDCRNTNATHRCFKAGDGRVNEFAGLTSMHTLLAREHNRMEEQLHNVNPHWGGEKLFQETRRLMTAVWQHVSYREFLPSVLGPVVMQQYGLTVGTSGHWNGYDSRKNAAITNSFATAAFRFGHSLIQGHIDMMDRAYDVQDQRLLSTMFRDPTVIYEPPNRGFDSMVRGMCGMNAQTRDSFITKQVTKHLFSEHPPLEPGEDLASLNMQRAREHGIPGYNFYREWCGLQKATTFRDLRGELPPAVIRRFQRLYKHVDDIDLFPAGISEYSVTGGLLGPVFSCIIANQFRGLKHGDRFWYENNQHNPHPFTSAQLQEIRKTSIASLICVNSDEIDEIQPLVLLQPHSKVFRNLREQNKPNDLGKYRHLYFGLNNELVKCGDLPQLNMLAWRESPRPLPAPRINRRRQFTNTQTSARGRRLRFPTARSGRDVINTREAVPERQQAAPEPERSSSQQTRTAVAYNIQDESILNDGSTVEIHVPVNTHLNIELNDRHNG